MSLDIAMCLGGEMDFGDEMTLGGEIIFYFM
jgi:hypothetical protein